MLVDQSVLGKTIAIILVVFGHLGFIQKGGAIGVSIFLVLSGYGLTKSYEKIKYDLRGYWKKRVVNVYIPFVICSFGIISVLYLTKSPILNAISEKNRIILGALGFPNNLYDPTMWYISYIFMMYLAFWLTFNFFEKRIMRVVAILIFCGIVGVLSLFIYSNAVGVYLYVFSFPIGVIFALYNNIELFFDNALKKQRIIICIGMFILLVYLSDKHILFYECLTIYTSLFIISILKRMQCFRNKKLLIIGKASYIIYLLEGIIMRSMWEYIGKDNFECNFICGIAILISGVFINYMSKNVCKVEKRNDK